MNRIFIGKISSERGEQITGNYYSGGELGSPWYNGIVAGDYIFPVHRGLIDRLWKMRGYEQKKNKQGQDETVAAFDIIKMYDTPVPLTDFCRYKYFDVDINLLNSR